MSEISKFGAKVENAEKWKSPELRISIREAQQLLKEIKQLQEKPLEVVHVSQEKPEEEIKTINLDGGSF